MRDLPAPLACLCTVIAPLAAARPVSHRFSIFNAPSSRSTWKTIPYLRFYRLFIPPTECYLLTMSFNSTSSFGPSAQRNFDFTPGFEDSILSIAPSALLLIAVPFRLWSLHKEPPKIIKSARFLYCNKLVCIMGKITN
jgi:hypothetical protein